MEHYKIFATLSFSGQKVFLNNKEMKILKTSLFVTNLETDIDYKKLGDYICRFYSPYWTILNFSHDPDPLDKSPSSIFHQKVEKEVNRFLNSFDEISTTPLVLNMLDYYVFDPNEFTDFLFNAIEEKGGNKVIKNSIFIFNDFPIHIIVGLFYINNYILTFEEKNELLSSKDLNKLLSTTLDFLESDSTKDKGEGRIINNNENIKIILDLKLYKNIDNYLETRKSSFDLNDFFQNP